MGSNKQGAKEIKRWILGEVIPSVIRFEGQPTKLYKKVEKENQIIATQLTDYQSLLQIGVTFWRLAQWRISELKTVNTPQKLMRGRMFN